MKTTTKIYSYLISCGHVEKVSENIKASGIVEREYIIPTEKKEIVLSLANLLQKMGYEVEVSSYKPYGVWFSCNSFEHNDSFSVNFSYGIDDFQTTSVFISDYNW